MGPYLNLVICVLLLNKFSYLEIKCVDPIQLSCALALGLSLAMAAVDNGLTLFEPTTGAEDGGQPWRIYGTDCQIVEVALQPGESAMCEPGMKKGKYC